MCTKYEAYKSVFPPETDRVSQRSIPSLDLADWESVRHSIARPNTAFTAGTEYRFPASPWPDCTSEVDDLHHEGDVDHEEDYVQRSDSALCQNEEASEYSTNSPLEKIWRENANALPDFRSQPGAGGKRAQSAFTWTQSRALDSQIGQIRRAIARRAVAQGIGFGLPASQTKISVQTEFKPEMYGLFTDKFRSEDNHWRRHRGGVSPRYLAQSPTMQPEPPPKRFVPEIAPKSQDPLKLLRKTQYDKVTFFPTDLHRGNVILPTAGMPAKRLRRLSLTTTASLEEELKGNALALWQSNATQKAKSLFRKGLSKWKDRIGDGKEGQEEEKGPLSDRKKAEVLAWLNGNSKQK